MRLSIRVVRFFWYADDIGLISNNESELELLIDEVYEVEEC